MTHDWKTEDYTEYRRDISRRSQAKRRKMARANGFCAICCKNPARPNKATCTECSRRISERRKMVRMGGAQ